MNVLSFHSQMIDVTQEREGWVDCIYLDVKKAFDKIPHKRLLWKLENLGGLKGDLLKWMEDFLSNGEMRTVVKVRMVQCEKLSSSRFSIGPSDVLGLCK